MAPRISSNDDLVFCGCCNRLVTRQTKYNHTKARNAPVLPSIKVNAITYRARVQAVAPQAAHSDAHLQPGSSDPLPAQSGSSEVLNNVAELAQPTDVNFSIEQSSTVPVSDLLLIYSILELTLLLLLAD